MLRTGAMLLVSCSNAAVHAAQTPPCMLRMCKHTFMPVASTQARVQQESKRDRGEELAGRRDIAREFDLSIVLCRTRGQQLFSLLHSCTLTLILALLLYTQRYKRF